MNKNELLHQLKIHRKMCIFLEKRLLALISELSPTDASNDTSDEHVNIIRAASPDELIIHYLFERRQHIREIQAMEKTLKSLSEDSKEE